MGGCSFGEKSGGSIQGAAALHPAVGRHADHDYAAGVRVPHRAQYRHQLPPAQIDAAAAGFGLCGRRVAADLRLRPHARFPFFELRGQLAVVVMIIQ